jgi:hypothetical protein
MSVMAILQELRSQEYRFHDGFDPVRRNLYADARTRDSDRNLHFESDNRSPY